MCSGNSAPMPRDNLTVPSCRDKKSKKKNWSCTFHLSLSLKMIPALPHLWQWHCTLECTISFTHNSIKPSKWPRGNKTKSHYCFHFQFVSSLFFVFLRSKQHVFYSLKTKTSLENSSLWMKPVSNQHVNKSSFRPKRQCILRGNGHIDTSWQISFAW